ncbi:MAG: hypothetical protein C0401_09140 [Anaerolinea sp.]|nr:hypothetical protein [Anaerolinea sp.]
MKVRLLILCLALTLLLVGCGPGTFTCPPAYLVMPLLSGPANWSIVNSLTPTLAWGYPPIPYPLPASTTNCIPQNYRVDLSMGPFFNINVGGTTAGNVVNFTPSVPLNPGKTYSWGVVPISAGVYGPYAGSRYFFTGEICDTAALAAPLPVSPYNGEDVDVLDPSLMWEYPEACRPEGYRIDLSTEPLFTDTSLAGGTGNSDTRWGPGSPLTNCTRYYWKVSPINGTTLGPSSATFTFRTNTGACGPDSGAPGSTITGKVWEELCSIYDGPLPSPLPVGCVATPGGGATGNGVLDPGEQGINNVLVRIGSGACPSTNEGVTFTNYTGVYSFANIPGGTHCVSIDVTDNIDVLVPGGWTFPSVPGSLAAQSFTVPDGDTQFGANFGWHYQFGPTTPYASVTGVVWDDECPQTGQTINGTPAAGCVKNSAGKAYADGTRQASEPGIAGVTVELLKGSCGNTTPPPVPFASTVTGANGEYLFMLPIYASNSLYCLTVDAGNSANTPILLPGLWPGIMFHPVIIDTATQLFSTYQVYGGEAHDEDFGWDYYEYHFAFDPGIFDIPALDIIGDGYCYIGPNFDYKAFKRLMAGAQYSILGLDPTRKWYMINPEEIFQPSTAPQATPTPVKPVRCWVPERNAKTHGDLGGLGIFTGPRIVTPTPTPTPTPVPPSYCSRYTTELNCNRDKIRCYWTGNYCADK